jgi:hypothetical protein
VRRVTCRFLPLLALLGLLAQCTPLQQATAPPSVSAPMVQKQTSETYENATVPPISPEEMLQRLNTTLDRA